MAQIDDDKLEDLKKKIDAALKILGRIRNDVEGDQAEQRVNAAQRALKTAKGIVDAISPVAGAQPTAATDSEPESEPAESFGDAGTVDSIAPFFEGVGRSVVEAQRLLDAQSREYMRESVGFPPTAFRLPRASAEIRFGIDKVTEKGFNILVAKSTQETRESLQHQVSFDIVATPLPPDLLAKLDAKTVSFPFLGNPLQREAIRTHLLEISEHAGQKSVREVCGELADSGLFPRLLIFSMKETGWAFLLPEVVTDEDDGKKSVKLDAWFLAADGSSMSKSVGRPLRKELAPLVELLVELSQRQTANLTDSESSE